MKRSDDFAAFVALEVLEHKLMNDQARFAGKLKFALSILSGMIERCLPSSSCQVLSRSCGDGSWDRILLQFSLLKHLLF